MKPFIGIGVTLMLAVAVVGIRPARAADEARQAYDRMVEEATKEADEYLEEKQQAIQAKQKRTATQRDAELQAKVDAERQRILEAMDTVQQRGMGPNYTQGMKDAQLEQLQQQLDRLMEDPQAYFGAN